MFSSKRNSSRVFVVRPRKLLRLGQEVGAEGLASRLFNWEEILEDSEFGGTQSRAGLNDWTERGWIEYGFRIKMILTN